MAAWNRSGHKVVSALARSGRLFINGVVSANNPYETDTLLQQYLIFHYATPEEQFPYAFGAKDALDFPRRCVTESVVPVEPIAKARALDIGCAVGRSSFELARFYAEVIGIDYSQAFVDAAERIRRDGSHPATRADEGNAVTRLDVSIDNAIPRDRVTFEQGDAQYLRENLGTFDAVLACNLVCRLPDPMRFLGRLPGLVRPGGLVFFTTPFTWLESHTPSESWLGGGGAGSFDGLRKALEPAFALQRRWDMPFLIREHARKFQYSIANASLWKREGGVTPAEADA